MGVKPMINVVIVDDDINVINGLKNVFKWEELGANLVMTCKNGKEVIDYMQENNVDLVISDIKMPVMNGIELCKHISVQYPNTSMVIISAYADFEYARETMKYGVEDYILKPINMTKIKSLSEIITKIAKSKDARLKLNAIIHNIDFERNVKNALSVSDSDILKEIIQLDDFYFKAGHQIIKEYYWKMIDILRGFIKETGSEFYEDEEIIKQFGQLNDMQTLRDFTMRTYEEFLDFRSFEKQTSKKTLFEQIRLYIDNNFNDTQLNVNSIAERFNVNPSYLSSMFKNHSSVSLTNYIIDKRIKKAKELLEETNQTVQKITELVGYEDVNYFNRVFKNNVKMTPTEYRKKYKGKV